MKRSAKRPRRYLVYAGNHCIGTVEAYTQRAAVHTAKKKFYNYIVTSVVEDER